MKKLFFTTTILLSFFIIPVKADKNLVDWVYPRENEISKNQKAIIYGKELVSKTFKYIGPEVNDQKMRFAGNNLRIVYNFLSLKNYNLKHI